MDSETQFSLNREEASAVLAKDMGVKITPHMQKVLDDVKNRAIDLNLNAAQVIAHAAFTEGVIPELSFDENFFRSRER